MVTKVRQLSTPLSYSELKEIYGSRNSIHGIAAEFKPYTIIGSLSGVYCRIGDEWENMPVELSSVEFKEGIYCDDGAFYQSSNYFGDTRDLVWVRGIKSEGTNEYAYCVFADIFSGKYKNYSIRLSCTMLEMVSRSIFEVYEEG